MAIKLKSGFQLSRFSDMNFDKMTIEIMFRKEEVAQINMEKGIDNLEIEFFTQFVDNKFKPKFYLSDLIEIFEQSKLLLSEYVPESERD
ncbi:hypothetical protein ACE5IS_19705 [Leptospira wolffii]|uniref:Uncharacterized protein n=1 Tax=Leptospira wolffii TaxID=409998 RepID=A0ABV5BWJ6_9LEPT